MATTVMTLEFDTIHHHSTTSLMKNSEAFVLLVFHQIQIKWKSCMVSHFGLE